MQKLLLLFIVLFSPKVDLFAQSYIVPDSAGWVVDFSKPLKEFYPSSDINYRKPLNEEMFNQIICNYRKIGYSQHFEMMDVVKSYRKSEKQQQDFRAVWNKRVLGLQKLYEYELKQAKLENRQPIAGFVFCVKYGSSKEFPYLNCA